MMNFRSKGAWRGVLSVIAIAGILAGCAGPNANGRPAAVPEIMPGFLAGYLPAEGIPDSLALLPPPPAPGSAALALDEEISRKSLTLRDTPRWKVAVWDAELRFPQAAGAYSCVLNAPITEADTPRLYMLLRRTLTDTGRTTQAAKKHYNRARPFVWNKEPICTPKDQPHLAKDGSYPSGHTTVGWAWALILAEIAPDRADAILARGLTFGESRNVCNVHWHSDVVQGRTLGAATLARLHAEPAFRAELEAVRAELAAVRTKGLKPARDCSAESAGLAVKPSLAQ